MDVFLGGEGEGKRISRVCVVCVIYYMLSRGGFVVACLQVIVKGGSSILGHPGQTSVMFQASTTRRPVHTLTTGEGLLPSFHHGLHGTVGMIFYAHVVYVVICYMSIICYMSVICLVQNPPQEEVVVFGYIEGPFLVRRTDFSRERHVPCIEGSLLDENVIHPNSCMNTSIWDMRTYRQVVVEPGEQFCTTIQMFL